MNFKKNKPQKKYYKITEDNKPFLHTRCLSHDLCLCVKCKTLFKIENVWYDRIYRCKNCNHASVISQFNQHKRIYLEIINKDNQIQNLKIINETLHYDIFNVDEVDDEMTFQISCRKSTEEQSFSADSLLKNNELWEIFQICALSELDSSKFMYFILKQIGVSAFDMSFNYYKAYEMICKCYYGEVLPVKEFVAQRIFDRFPIFNLSKDFFEAIYYDSNRKILKDKKISSMEEFCNFLNLPYKPNILRILTQYKPKDIDIKTIQTFCSLIDNFDLKCDLLEYLIENPMYGSDWSYYKSHHYLLDQYVDQLKFFIKHFKEELTEKQLLNFIKSMVDYEFNSDTIRMFKEIMLSETFKGEKILYENRKNLTVSKLHNLLVDYISILKMKNEDIPFMLDSECSLKYEAKVDELNFKMPKKPSDLVKWSQLMHNCISSYVDRFRDGSCILLGVYDKDTLLYNVEIVNDKAVQIKGKNNTKITDSKHKNIIDKYLHMRQIC